MKVLIIGGGGREHALAWKICRSPRITRVFVAPGNAGTAGEPLVENVALGSIDTLVKFALDHEIGMTIVGPEAPLADGVVDAFRAADLPIFGPTKQAAQLESSKDFCKQFLVRHNIPTARYASFTEPDAAHAYIDAEGAPIVVKADGLAAGKGVVVATTAEEAHAAVDMMMRDAGMGQAGARVVIEEFMQGEEASFIVLADGRHALALASSQDHKRLKDGDSGPNTGGMGAYSPAPVVTPQVHARVMREIIQPTLAGMASEGAPYTGFLYAGLMIDKAGKPRVVEFNCRLGDPETQPIMVRLKSDLVELIEAALNGRLDTAEAEWDRRIALGVVLAAEGYPARPRVGDVISGVPAESDDMCVFHAGTARDDGRIVTTGGRVLCVTTLSDHMRTAQTRAYDVADRIAFAGKQFRRDIGHRATKR